MATSRDPTILRELVSLISQSVQAVVDHDASQSQSLDATGSDDALSSEAGKPLSHEVIVVLESACAQLCAIIAPAERTMANYSFAALTPACIRVALEARVAEHLREGPKSVAELAGLTGVDAGKLSRVLRHLTLRHCFIEVRTDVFANTKLSACLLPEDPTSALIALSVDELSRGFGRLSDVLLHPEWTSSTDKEKTAFAREYGMHLFKSTEVEHIRGARFAKAMLGYAKLFGGHSVLIQSYSWSALAPDATFCDVGAGVGHVAAELLAAQPHMKAVVQDQPETIRKAYEFWRTEAPALIDNGRAQLVPVDFFAEPPTAGCAVYYLKHILHDWPDADCAVILRNVRAAMTAPHARVLIHEIVLNYHSSPPPFPLIPNYGVGAQTTYNMDLNMMSTLNSRERTLDEFIALGKQAGLKYVKLWDGGELKMLEFELE